MFTDLVAYSPLYNGSGSAEASGLLHADKLALNWSGDLPVYGVVFNIIGALIILICYLPGTINSVRNRQTQDMSWGMWNITVFALLMLSIFAACGIAESMPHAGKFAFTFICEFGCFLTALTVWLVKLSNVMTAKKQGLTEREWCEQYAKNHPSRMKPISFKRK